MVAVASAAPFSGSMASLLALRRLCVALCPAWGAAAGCKAWWRCVITAAVISLCSAGLERGGLQERGRGLAGGSAVSGWEAGARLCAE